MFECETTEYIPVKNQIHVFTGADNTDVAIRLNDIVIVEEQYSRRGYSLVHLRNGKSVLVLGITKDIVSMMNDE